MAENFDHLINRIKTEGIDAAETEAARIVAQAKTRAAEIIREGETRAAEYMTKAEADATVYTEQSKRVLEQAARDLIISIGEGVDGIMEDIIENAVVESLDISLLQNLLAKAVETYLEKDGHENRIKVLLSRDDKEQLIRFFQDRYTHHLNKDLEVVIDENLLKGFRVIIGEGRMYHDFSEEAITEALSGYLRPKLSEIVQRAARKQHTNGTASAE